jgi:hypothetical protein
VLLNVLLFAAFANCTISGLSAAVLPLSCPGHTLSLFVFSIILTIHVLRHLKWARNVLRSVFFTNPSQPT